MDKIKKTKDKGFTLVELIVVLVILAVLAAILIPALLGYIDRAKGQKYILNAHTFYESVQATVTEEYAKPTQWTLNNQNGLHAGAHTPTGSTDGCAYLMLTNRGGDGCKSLNGWGDYGIGMVKRASQVWDLMDASTIDPFIAVALIEGYKVSAIYYWDYTSDKVAYWTAEGKVWETEAYKSSNWNSYLADVVTKSKNYGSATDAAYNRNGVAR